MNAIVHYAKDLRRQRRFWTVTLPAVALLGLLLFGRGFADQDGIPNLKGEPNEAGVMRTFTTAGSIDRTNPFFKPVGSTPRTCEHCHFASDAFGLSARHARDLFDQSRGTHPLFLPDAANNPATAQALPANANQAQLRAAYSLMLDKGLAVSKVPLRLPTDSPRAEFRLAGIVDPAIPDLPTTTLPNGDTVGKPDAYFALTGTDPATGDPRLWLHRRPLPTTNFKFLTAALWDGRSTANPNPENPPVGIPTLSGLLGVGFDAIAGRLAPDNKAADGHTFTVTEKNALAQQFLELELTLFTAQAEVHGAGRLDARGALGGPEQLAGQPFYFGMNDVLEGDFTTRQPFDPEVFRIYRAWESDPNPHRASIARGEKLFNSLRLNITGVGGLNNASITLPLSGPSHGATITGPAAIPNGACSSCHDLPNVGDHSTRLPIDIGVVDPAPAALGHDAVSGLPVFTFHRIDPNTNQDLDWSDPSNTRRVTDPGRAARSGKWAHIGQFKGPILRGVAARAPYFHNGMADTLEDVVEFYSERFQAGFTRQEKQDLVAFLESL